MRLLLAALLLPVAGAATPGTNFMVLFMDDNGWGDNGCNDPNVTETPRIDQMAREGIRFSDFHASYSVCTASRGALLTGRLCPRTGVCNNFGPNSIHGMAAGELTMADILTAGGYDAHMIGKWHLGHNEGYHPTYRGFMTYTGLPYSGDMGCLDSDPPNCEHPRGSSPACPARCGADLVGNGGGETAIPLYASSNEWDGWNCSGRKCSQEIVLAPFDPFALNDHYVGRAKDIFARYGNGGAKQGTPFLLYVAFAHTHTPLAYAPKWANASSRPAHARSGKVFGDTVAEVDGAIGAMLDSLDASGLGEDTLVFLTADNGPADLGSVNCWAIGSPGPYVGAWQRSDGGGGSTCKGTVWEGGHRMVGVARWKGRLHQPGRSTTALAQTIDFLPTFASIAGVALPTDRAYDGIDLSPVLLQGSDAGHTTLFHPSGNGKPPAMRYGQYKAFFTTSGASPCKNEGEPLEAAWVEGAAVGRSINHDPPLIFDLDADPAESRPVNVSTEILGHIQAAADAFWASVNDEKNLRSKTDYSQDSAHRPCGNASSACCRVSPK